MARFHCHQRHLRHHHHYYYYRRQRNTIRTAKWVRQARPADRFRRKFHGEIGFIGMATKNTAAAVKENVKKKKMRGAGRSLDGASFFLEFDQGAHDGHLLVHGHVAAFGSGQFGKTLKEGVGDLLLDDFLPGWRGSAAAVGRCFALVDERCAGYFVATFGFGRLRSLLLAERLFQRRLLAT
jgi:hypothetical protein